MATRKIIWLAKTRSSSWVPNIVETMGMDSATQAQATARKSVGTRALLSSSYRITSKRQGIVTDRVIDISCAMDDVHPHGPSNNSHKAATRYQHAHCQHAFGASLVNWQWCKLEHGKWRTPSSTRQVTATGQKSRRKAATGCVPLTCLVFNFGTMLTKVQMMSMADVGVGSRNKNEQERQHLCHPGVASKQSRRAKERGSAPGWVTIIGSYMFLWNKNWCWLVHTKWVKYPLVARIMARKERGKGERLQTKTFSNRSRWSRKSHVGKVLAHKEGCTTPQGERTRGTGVCMFFPL